MKPPLGHPFLKGTLASLRSPWPLFPCEFAQNFLELIRCGPARFGTTLPRQYRGPETDLRHLEAWVARDLLGRRRSLRATPASRDAQINHVNRNRHADAAIGEGDDNCEPRPDDTPGSSQAEDNHEFPLVHEADRRPKND